MAQREKEREKRIDHRRWGRREKREREREREREDLAAIDRARRDPNKVKAKSSRV